MSTAGRPQPSPRRSDDPEVVLEHIRQLWDELARAPFHEPSKRARHDGIVREIRALADAYRQLIRHGPGFDDTR